jgi:regulator of protease activity HflC (stomatin/prohibitin superfamily)
MEKNFKPFSGYLLLVILVLLGTGLYYLIMLKHVVLIAIVALIIIMILSGFFVVSPNNSKVVTLLGKYIGTVKDNGFFWANPFFLKNTMSLKARNLESERIKVNDKRGNPILISVITVWKVSNTYKAAFDVDHYEQFVRLQSDAAVRNLAGSYSYDNFDDTDEITLRGGTEDINKALEIALSERLSMAGIEVLEARIGYLAYAEEIASVMLKRQQAEAVVAARHKIVEGAVSMVEMALEDLSKRNIIELDDDKKASMVSNLMVILCSDKEAIPVVNTGTLH